MQTTAHSLSLCVFVAAARFEEEVGPSQLLAAIREPVPELPVSCRPSMDQ